MQIQDLTLFQAMYALKSINQAANQQGYSQSNVSARLQALEDELQTTLFVRGYQGLTPTAAGITFHDYATRVLAATAALRRQLAQEKTPREITISELLFDYLVVDQKKYDLASYHFTIKKSTEIVADRSDSAGLVITYAHFQNDNYRLLGRGWLQTAYAAQAAMPQDLPLLVNRDPNCPFRRATLAATNGQPVKEIDSWSGIVALVEAGAGVALLPQFLIRQHQLMTVADRPAMKIPYWTFQKEQPLAKAVTNQ